MTGAVATANPSSSAGSSFISQCSLSFCKLNTAVVATLPAFPVAATATTSSILTRSIYPTIQERLNITFAILYHC